MEYKDMTVADIALFYKNLTPVQKELALESNPFKKNGISDYEMYEIRMAINDSCKDE